MAVLLFVGTMAVGNAFIPAEKAVTRRSAGHDFVAFYTAGTFVRTGRAHELYDLGAVKSFQQELAGREGLELGPDDFGPWWNPPFFALVFAPLSAMDYRTGWNVWFAMNLAAAAGAMTILALMVAWAPRPCVSTSSTGEAPVPLADHIDWRTWALVPLLIVTSLPFIQALGHGQNTCISLLLLSATVALWRSDRAVAAGIVAGLLFYKPQLGALVAAALVITTGWRPLVGLAITGTSLLAITLVALPGTLFDFLTRLPHNVAFMQAGRRYMWERHVTLKSFWRLLIQGYEIGDLSPLTQALWIASAAALGLALFAILWKTGRSSDRARTDRAIAATVVAMPLLMPFYFDYDLLLLSVAAVLVARERVAATDERVARLAVTRPLLATWFALWVWLFLNPALAGRTHVNGTVVLLGMLATMLIARAWKQQRFEDVRDDGSVFQHEPARRAA